MERLWAGHLEAIVVFSYPGGQLITFPVQGSVLRIRGRLVVVVLHRDLSGALPYGEGTARSGDLKIVELDDSNEPKP